MSKCLLDEIRIGPSESVLRLKTLCAHATPSSADGIALRPQPGYQAPQQGFPHFDRRTTPPLLGYDSTAAGTRPYYGPTPAANEQVITRPHFPTEPGRIDSVANESDGDPRTMAAFPPEVRPETGPKKELPAQFHRTLVDYFTKEPAGTIIVDTQNTYLYLVLGNGKALRYGIGREGFTWSGVERVSKVAEWPDWNPPEEMIVRQPYLPRFMAGGETNPLGARALPGQDSLPHPRHQSAFDDRHLRFLRLYSPH